MIGPPPIDITRAVRTELAVPGRYHLEKAAPAHRSLFGLIFQWFYDRWNDLWSALTSHIKIGAAGVSIIGDVLIVACVIAIGLIAAHLLAQFEYERTRRERAIALTQPRSAHALAALAGQAASAGDYARAVRLLFMAAVTLLDLRGVVRDERSATVNELRRRLHERDGALEPAFVEIARLYTATAYAQMPAGPDAWQRARAAYDQLAGSAAS
jgi:Domain of unknown function (DUF4129)